MLGLAAWWRRLVGEGGPGGEPGAEELVVLGVTRVGDLELERRRHSRGDVFGRHTVRCGDLVLDEGGAGTGGRVWPPTLVVAARVGPALFDGARVLEIGSGIGLLPLLLLRRTRVRSIVATDTERAVPLLASNAERNAPGDLASGRLSVRALEWGAGAPPPAPCDVLLGSDVLYNERLYPDILRTIALAKPRRVVMAYEERQPEAEARFFAELPAGAEVAREGAVRVVVVDLCGALGTTTTAVL